MPLDSSTQLDFGALARKLDSVLDEWRVSELDKSRQAQPKIAAEMATCVNLIAREFGVIGGAFGVANKETNTFDLLRGYPSEKEGPLFPYEEPEPESTDLFAFLRKALPSHQLDYSTWMHRLFVVQRQTQLFEVMEDSPRLKVPEFFRSFTGKSPPIIVLRTNILKVLENWIDLWDIASRCRLGLGTSIEEALKQSTCDNGLGLLECITRTWDSTPSWATGHAEKLRLLPESHFFINQPQSTNAVVTVLHELATRVTLSDIRTRLFSTRDQNHNLIQRFHKLIQELRTQDTGVGHIPISEDAFLLRVLGKIHDNALFPIIPYLFLSILDNRNLFHFILPLLKTTEFPLEVVHVQENPRIVPCGLVMLGTGAANAEMSQTSPDDRIQRHLYSFSLLMRLAAEPIVDKTFYGGIQRRRRHGEAMSAFAHQIKSPASKTDQGWLVSRDRWADICQWAQNNKLEAHIDQCKIAPAPDIFRALGSTLLLWSLSFNPSDLYPPSDLNPDGTFPANMYELQQRAENLSFDSALIRFAANKNFETRMGDVNGVWTHNSKQSRTIDAKRLARYLIERQYFVSEHNMLEVTKNNRRAHIELSGLLRILVVACENFLYHTLPDASMSIVAVIQDKEFNIECTNNKGSCRTPNRNYLGMTGTDLIDYLCREFLGTLGAIAHSDDKSGNQYTVKVAMRRPEWLQEVSG